MWVTALKYSRSRLSEGDGCANLRHLGNGYQSLLGEGALGDAPRHPLADGQMADACPDMRRSPSMKVIIKFQVTCVEAKVQLRR